MTRYEEPMTKGGVAVIVSFLIIALLSVFSVWIPALHPIAERAFETVTGFWMVVFIFGGAFVNFATWMSKY